MSFELRHLRYVDAAAERGSFRKAADVLGIQKSTMSRCIRDLEDELGASLFQRHHGGVTLTLAGRRFLSRTRKALRQINDGVSEVAALGRSEDGCIKIGILSSLDSGFLPDLLRAYSKAHAGVRIEFINGNPSELASAIRQLHLDVAFVTRTGDWSECEVDQLWSERVFAVLPSGHILSQKAELVWSDLVGETFIVNDTAPGPVIRDYLMQRLADFGYQPDSSPSICRAGQSPVSRCDRTRLDAH